MFKTQHQDPSQIAAPKSISNHIQVTAAPPTNADPEQQKNMLMNALGGLGFEPTRVKSEKSITGIIYGPDDATYYSVTEKDSKKKKSVKGLLGVSQVDKTVYFVIDASVKASFYFRQRR